MRQYIGIIEFCQDQGGGGGVLSRGVYTERHYISVLAAVFSPAVLLQAALISNTVPTHINTQNFVLLLSAPFHLL